MKKTLLALTIAASVLPRVSAQPADDITVVHVQKNVYLLASRAGNVAVQIGDDGVLLVDTGTAAMSAKVIAAVKSISPKPLRYIVNTTHTPEHVGGNLPVAKTGEIIPFREPDYTAGPQGALDVHKASVISYLNVFHRMAAATGPTAVPEEGWPDNTYSIEQKRLYFNDEPVVIQHFVGNDDGNSVVLFRKSDVVAVGDLLDLTKYPRIDPENGGGIQQMVDSMNKLIDIVVPEANAAGGHAGDSGARADRGSCRGGVLPRHAGDHSRPAAGRDQAEADAGADQGGAADAGLRRPVWQDDGAVDDRHVCRGGI